MKFSNILPDASTGHSYIVNLDWELYTRAYEECYESNRTALKMD